MQTYCVHDRAEWEKLFSAAALAEHDLAPATQVIREFVPNPDWVSAPYEIATAPAGLVHVGPPPTFSV